MAYTSERVIQDSANPENRLTVTTKTNPDAPGLDRYAETVIDLGMNHERIGRIRIGVFEGRVLVHVYKDESGKSVEDGSIENLTEVDVHVLYGDELPEKFVVGTKWSIYDVQVVLAETFSGFELTDEEKVAVLRDAEEKLSATNSCDWEFIEESIGELYRERLEAAGFAFSEFGEVMQ